MDEAARDRKHALALLRLRAVCICNNIKYGRVADAIGRGARTIDEVANATGCTTGECLGERCRPVILEMLAEDARRTR